MRESAVSIAVYEFSEIWAMTIRSARSGMKSVSRPESTAAFVIPSTAISEISEKIPPRRSEGKAVISSP
jgi:hypothetical protein